MEKPFKLVNGTQVELTEEEIRKRKEEIEVINNFNKTEEWKHKRIQAYIKEGWIEPFDIFNSMIKIGVNEVLNKRKEIQDLYPDPKEEKPKKD